MDAAGRRIFSKQLPAGKMPLNIGQTDCTIASATSINIIQFLNQIGNDTTRNDTSRRYAEMSPARQRATFIDHAQIRSGIEKGAGSVRRRFDANAPGSTPALPDDPSLSYGYVGNLSRQTETATVRLPFTGTDNLSHPFRALPQNGADPGQYLRRRLGLPRRFSTIFSMIAKPFHQ